MSCGNAPHCRESAPSYFFATAGGNGVGVVAHVNGRRDVLLYDPEVWHTTALTEVEALSVAQVVFVDAGPERRTAAH